MGAIGGVVVGLGICLVGLAFHGVPVYYCLMHFVRGVGRAAAGLDQIALSKSYDRAEGAESRGNLEEAAALYRQELDTDPEDTEARRRLAELLVKQGRAQEAVPEFETVVEQVADREKRYAATFRLAEVLEEELGRRQEAAELYRRIVEEDPRSRYAQYARSRLGHGDPSDAPSDH
jgi:tetratricopeptide (TPR) repeat protein